MKDLNIPGLLIEYLVVGSTALLWLLPLVGTTYGAMVGQMKVENALLLLPSIYVLGMLIDHVAYVCVSSPKAWNLKEWARKEMRAKDDVAPYVAGLAKDGEGRANRSHIHLARTQEALLTELQVRSSRDRIARSAIINFAILTVVLLVNQKQPAPAALAAIATVVALSAWKRFEADTYAFELRALIETHFPMQSGRAAAAPETDSGTG